MPAKKIRCRNSLNEERARVNGLPPKPISQLGTKTAAAKKKSATTKARSRGSCQGQARGDRGQPWVRCTNERQVRLIHKGLPMEYCRECAALILDRFPAGTFTQESIRDA